MRSILLLTVYIFAFVGSNLCFRKAGVFPNASMMWWVWFSVGNMAGFFAPISMTLALKGESSSWIFSLAIGLSFLVLQVSLWCFQSEPFNRFQGAGVFLITTGLILMQWGKGS